MQRARQQYLEKSSRIEALRHLRQQALCIHLLTPSNGRYRLQALACALGVAWAGLFAGKLPYHRKYVNVPVVSL